jgi:hypothetical protein
MARQSRSHQKPNGPENPITAIEALGGYYNLSDSGDISGWKNLLHSINLSVQKQVILNKTFCPGFDQTLNNL